MNYKKFGIAFAFALLLFASLTVVTAAEEDEFNRLTGGDESSAGETVEEWIDTITEVANPIFKWIIGDSFNKAGEADGQEFAMRILAFFLAIIIVYGLLEKIKILEKTWMNFGIGLIVAIIGIRFLPEGMLEAFAAPSSAFVAFLFLGIPFALIFYIMTAIRKPAVRRIAWVIYAIILYAIVASNWNEGNDWWYLYVAFGFGALAMAVFDGTIEKFWSKFAMKRAVEGTSASQADRLIAEVRDLEGALAAETNKKTPDKRRMANLENKIEAKKQLMKKFR